MDATKYKFKKLTPVKDAELNVYADSLDYVFRDEDLKNIAITGSYSSGKSSILDSYKATHPDKKFLHISLAHFKTATGSSEAGNSNIGDDVVDKGKLNQKFEANIKTVEGKILNQLIHQIATEKIPQTHFKIKRPISRKTLISLSAMITIFLTLAIFLFNKITWLTFVEGISIHWLQSLLRITTNDLFILVALGVCIFIVFLGVQSLEASA